MATRKNRSENGRRAVPNGSNPHSYGDSFSVSGCVWGSQKLMVISRAVIPMVIINMVAVLIILPRVESRLNDWKSFVLLILEE